MKKIQKPKNIIIRMPNWLGDAVMGTPVLQDVKNAYPDASLTVLCHNAIQILLKENPFIDHFITFARDKKRSKSEKQKVFSALRNGFFDTGILLTRSFSSAWWFYRGNIKNRIGFKDHMRSLLLTHPYAVPVNEEQEHQVITYKRLLSAIDIPQSNTEPELYLKDEEVKNARKLLQEYGIQDEQVVGINPGAAFGSSKCWPKERFIEVTKKLTQNGVRVVFFGDSLGKPLIDEICQKCPTNVVNLATKTNLRELIALLSCMTCVVSNDSGPMHAASAIKAPLVAIFGSTNEVKTGPYRAATIIHKHVMCSPCYLRSCPIDHRCMKSISVDEVFNAIAHYLTK